MVKRIQIIRRVLPRNCLSVFGHFGGLAVKGLTDKLITSLVNLAVQDLFLTQHKNIFVKLIYYISFFL